MQTERVTFLTSPDHKAALDAFAATSGKSVGHVLREASSQYIAREPAAPDEYEEALELVLPELEMRLARWNSQLDSMHASIDRARAAIDAALQGDPA
ncbi:hypothetical protein [Sphingomonas bacterium]|uniref:hypothetical protein n=1 Tax=Sphingomonas bacterium TaxID=1895847 RepID=UPI0015767380|nr:hypothetical protein [Sphingomonas bacterium]